MSYLRFRTWDPCELAHTHLVHYMDSHVTYAQLNHSPCRLRADLQYGGEGLRSVKNAWPRHGYMRQMMDVPEKK